MVINSNDGSVAGDDFEQSISSKEPDTYQILRQIIQNEPISTSTYWQGYLLLPPAHTYTYDTQLKTSIIKTDLTSLKAQRPHANEDPFELITAHISEVHKNNNNGKIVVRFSGGVDSTCLLLAAIEVAGKDHVIAITWLDDKCSANEDKNTSIALCNSMNVKHLLFKLEPQDFFQNINPTDHFCINPSMASDQVFKNERDFISSRLGDEYIILDGHGGDHLFLDPIPTIAFQHPIREKRLLKGIEVATTISRLTGSSIYETLTHNRNQRANETDRLNYFFNIQISSQPKQEPPKTLVDEHVQAIAQAISQNSTDSTLKKPGNIFYPFTSKIMIEYALTQDPYTMFNERDTRAPLKLAIRKKYPWIQLRSDKGHITGAYQKALKLHQTAILNKIRNSWLAQQNIINMPNIERSITHSTMGLGGIEKNLLKIICACLIKAN
nr:asparagine synthase-related protein [Pseudomonas ekonensis]